MKLEEYRKEKGTYKQHSRLRKAGKVAARIGICLGTFLLVVVLALCALLTVVCRGPSAAAKELFVMTVSETGQAGFLAYWFLPDAEVDQIRAKNALADSEIPVDTNQIQIPLPGEKGEEGENAIEIVEITGRNYTGKMMIVRDPSRVSVGTAEAYGSGKHGYSTLEMAKRTNSLAAVNAGGYYDTGNYTTSGGIPMGRGSEDGLVIAGGELLWGELDQKYEIIGFDKNHVFRAEKMTARKALEVGIRDAVNFGPVLVVNGKPNVFTNEAVNPRTAIGQRADGAVLLLVINGRQPNSLGATYADLTEIMVRFGAVNAANLDGGMSAYMVYENEVITSPCTGYGLRNVATSFLVARQEGEGD